MALAGLIVTLLGFVIAVFSLQLTTDVYARLAIVIVGILVSLGGIIGLINPAYMKNAIWKRGSR
ncbi:MAG: hypothetical protein ABI824_05230 [Acidobacteriota bacterium]